MGLFRFFAGVMASGEALAAISLRDRTAGLNAACCELLSFNGDLNKPWGISGLGIRLVAFSGSTVSEKLEIFTLHLHAQVRDRQMLLL